MSYTHAPGVRVDLSTREPLTRPPSPSRFDDLARCSLAYVLPLEIRQQIWQNVLEGHTFHLRIEDGRLVGLVCISEEPSSCNVGWGPCWSHLPGGLRERIRVPLLHTVREERRLLSLLLTCRQFYSEAIKYLYSSNIFVVNDATILQRLPSLLPQPRQHSIASLRFCYVLPLPPLVDSSPAVREEWAQRRERWDGVWSDLASLQGLRELYVKLAVMDLEWGSVDEGSLSMLLEPVRKITKPRAFVLVLPCRPMVWNARKPVPMFPWSAGNGESMDLWEKLPCTVLRM